MDKLLERLRGKIPEHVVSTLPLILKKDTIKRLGDLDADKVGRIMLEAVE